VTSVLNLSWVLSPLGSLLAGTGSDLFKGPKMITIILASVAAGISVFIFLFSPTVRNYKLSEGMAPVSARTSSDLSE
jgi:sugar phosphate permease